LTDLKSVCVYCGSRPGEKPCYAEAARGMGKILAASNIELVFGGGDVGLMGLVANAVIDEGGRVTGILPRFLGKVEMPAVRIHELILTETMHERKALMHERSDGFCVLPGGVGTIEEMVEMISWAYLQQHAKPIVLVNLEGYWDPFLTLFDHIAAQGFSAPDLPQVWRVVDRIEDVIPTMRKWLQGNGDMHPTKI